MRDKKWLVPVVVDPVERICVQLEIPNDLHHIAAFFGALDQLGMAYNWEDSYADGSDTAYVWQAIITNAANLVRIGESCMDCGDVRDCLDVDPVSLAEGGAISVIFDGAAESHIDDLEALYDDVTPQSVFPDIITTAASADGNDDDALCYALRGFVGFYAALKLHGISIDSNDGSYWDRIKSAAVYVWQTLKSYAGNIWGLLTGTVPLADAKASLIDDDEIEGLACCLWEEIRTAPLTETTWNSAINACEMANNIGVMLKSDNATRTYIYFLETYNAAIQRQLLDEVLDCVCLDDWCYEWDFTVASGPNVAGRWVGTGPSELRGIYSAGNGWIPCSGCFGRDSVFIEIAFPTTATKVTQVEFELSTPMTGNHRFVGVQHWDGVGTPDPTGVIDGEWHLGFSSTVKTFFVNYFSVDGITVAYDSTAGMGPQLTTAIKRLKISGKGTNPFGADNC